MNPLPLLLLALASKNGNPSSRSFSGVGNPPIDSLLTTLQSTVHTLEQVNQLSQMGTKLTPAKPASLPVAAASSDPSDSGTSSGLDLSILSSPELQNAMQNLAPILSMLGNNKK